MLLQDYKKMFFLVLFICLMIFINPVNAQRFSISSWGSPQHPQVTEFVPVFTETLQANVSKKLRIKTFQGGEMVKQDFVSTAIPQGTVDISLTTMDTWSGRIPEVSILTSPLWNKSMEWTRDNLTPGHPIFEYFNDKFKAQGAILLAILDIGPPVLASRKLVTNPVDLKGQSIRVYSRGAGLVLQELKGSPVTMGVGDVYSALQRGTIDGALGGLGGAVGLKYYEVTKYLFVPNGVIGALLNAYVMNKDKYDSLDEETKKAVDLAAEKARASAQQALIDMYDEQLEEVRDFGNTVTMVEPNSNEWDIWEEALRKFTENAMDSYPNELTELLDMN